METRLLKKNEQAPLELLLTADPSATLIKGYLDRGHCYIAEIDNQAAGVYVLVETSDDTAELINIAGDGKHQGKGIGKALVKDAIQKQKTWALKRLKLVLVIQVLINSHCIRNAASGLQAWIRISL